MLISDPDIIGVGMAFPVDSKVQFRIRMTLEEVMAKLIWNVQELVGQMKRERVCVCVGKNMVK